MLFPGAAGTWAPVIFALARSRPGQKAEPYNSDEGGNSILLPAAFARTTSAQFDASNFKLTMDTSGSVNVANDNISPWGSARGRAGRGWSDDRERGARRAASCARRLAAPGFPTAPHTGTLRTVKPCSLRSWPLKASSTFIRPGKPRRPGAWRGLCAFALEHPQLFRLMFSRARALTDLQAQFGNSFAHLGADATSGWGRGVVARARAGVQLLLEAGLRTARASCARCWARCASPKAAVA